MHECDSLENRNNCFIKVLGSIVEQSDKDIILINSLYANKQNGVNCETCILSMLSMLHFFGVISFVQIDNLTAIKIKSLPAKYFIMSLKEYVSNGLTLLSKWEENKGKIPATDEKNIFSGPQFLYYMEEKRVKECKNAAPIRRGEVARAIFKARSIEYHEDAYLFQYDSKTMQYKIIGGNVESYDKSPQDAIIREIQEELRASHLSYGKNYKLTPLHESSNRLISYVYGAYSEYKNYFFYVYSFNEKDLILGGHDRWITTTEIKNCKTREGDAIFPLDNELLEKIEKLLPSIEIGNKKRYFNILNKMNSDKAQVIIGVIGILVAILFGILALK